MFSQKTPEKGAMNAPTKTISKHVTAFMVLSILLGIVAANQPEAAQKTRSSAVSPTKGTPVAVVTGKNIKPYFICSQQQPLELSITGPGTLEITTRLLLPTGKTEGSYTVELREGPKLLEQHETRSQIATARLSGRPETVAKSRKFHYELPEGQHRLTLFLAAGDYPEVAARFSLSIYKTKGAHVAVAPLSYARSATVIIKEKQFTYYAAKPGQPVKFRVLGPARLKVVSRLVYDERMKGAQKYTVTASEGGKQVTQFPLETTKSISVSFRDWPEVVPGKSRTFYLDVPNGEHQYDFGISGSVARGVALLFALPKTSLSNEKND